MEGHELLIKYLVGAGVLAACLLGAIIIAMVERRKRNWSRSIIVHVV
ncbi:hypothetical protein [Kerstersia gyiorum]|nr:hypothetical protein [Kerstersia gyiorum]MCP1671229.1 hypothetical protein [Kerstersia gyiorum]MCP1709174.1 hypothetical protein [Kerstersia gyiorum]